jgi:hypothetical protein
MIGPIGWGSVEIKEWRMSTGDSRDLDWRLHVGFLGHGNIPHIWSAEKQCWLPVAESMTDQASAKPVAPDGQ